MPKTLDSLDFIGAGERIRTAGFLITSEILYQLSYAGTVEHGLYQDGPGNSRNLTPVANPEPSSFSLVYSCIFRD